MFLFCEHVFSRSGREGSEKDAIWGMSGVILWQDGIMLSCSCHCRYFSWSCASAAHALLRLRALDTYCCRRHREYDKICRRMKRQVLWRRTGIIKLAKAFSDTAEWPIYCIWFQWSQHSWNKHNVVVLPLFYSLKIIDLAKKLLFANRRQIIILNLQWRERLASQKPSFVIGLAGKGKSLILNT